MGCISLRAQLKGSAFFDPAKEKRIYFHDFAWEANLNQANRLYKPMPENRAESTNPNSGLKYANYGSFCKPLTLWHLQNRLFFSFEKPTWKVTFYASFSYFLLLIPALSTIKSSTFSH